MDREQFFKEIEYSFSRSGGPGGQHANKVSTKVHAVVNLKDSSAFTQAEKERLLTRLSNKLTAAGELKMSCDSTRSQVENKRILQDRILSLILEKSKNAKKRIPTRTPRSVKEKRLEKKKKQAHKKAMRKKPDRE